MTPDQIKQLYVAYFEKQASQVVRDSFENLGITDEAKSSLTTAIVSTYRKGWEAREEYIPIDRARPKTNQRILIKYRTLHHNEKPDPDVQIATLHMANSFVQITDEVLAYPGEFIWYIPALRKYLPFGAVMEWMFIPGHDYTEK